MSAVPHRLARVLGRVVVAGVLGVVTWACTGPPPPPAGRSVPTGGQTPSVAKRNPPADHTKDRKGVRHKSGSKQAVANCSPCHGQDLKGGQGPSCFTCHGQEWH